MARPWRANVTAKASSEQAQGGHDQAVGPAGQKGPEAAGQDGDEDFTADDTEVEDAEEGQNRRGPGLGGRKQGGHAYRGPEEVGMGIEQVGGHAPTQGARGPVGPRPRPEGGPSGTPRRSGPAGRPGQGQAAAQGRGPVFQARQDKPGQKQDGRVGDQGGQRHLDAFPGPMPHGLGQDQGQQRPRGQRPAEKAETGADQARMKLFRDACLRFR